MCQMSCLAYVILCCISLHASSLKVHSVLQSATFLRALESGVKITTSLEQRNHGWHKDDIIRVGVGNGITFNSYCNTHYCELRRLAGFSSEQFARSMQEFSPINADSKSGQCLWKSWDGSVILKTVASHESKTMREMIDAYTSYISDDSQPSCLSLILGLYSIELNGEMLNFLASKNVFPETSSEKEVYDIKGSTIGRIATPKSKVKKDMDALLKLRQSEDKIFNVRPTDMELFTAAVKRDSTFLKSLNLMDYSLLVAIETIPSLPSFRSASRTRPMIGGRDGVIAKVGSLRSALNTKYDLHEDGRPNSCCGKMILEGDHSNCWYHVGIVDFLQKYTFRKRLETIGKGIWYNAARISAVNPKIYAQRFVKFIMLLSGAEYEES